MNNLRFLNHPILLSLDPNVLKTTLYPEYMSIYRFFPNPPGVEFFNSRNMHIDLKSPWLLEPTEYTMPAMPTSPVTFEEAADTFGAEVSAEIDNGKDVYMMWSGGIDSTSIAVSVLRNIKTNQHKKLHIVSSALSREENPMFHHNFLAKFDQIELKSFDPGLLDLSSSLILDGEGGDQIFGSSAANKLFSIYPEMILKPWRTNIDFLHQYWHKDSVPGFYEFFMNLMETTINQGSAPVDTLYDFYWWLNFNFKFDSVMYRHTLRLSENVPDDQFEHFSKNVLKRMFAHEKIQQWSMSCGAVDKIHTARKTIKWGARQYIYEFDHNEYYFREKRKEFSTETIANTTAKYIAVDKNYKRYTIADRATRQSLRETFYPEMQGRISMPKNDLWVG
jgi:asparagine synthetase B (glutamine-hydrolysing)